MLCLFHREMLERVLVKRLRDSDSDSEKEEESSTCQSKTSSTDKPTDILTTDETTETQVHLITHMTRICLLGLSQSPACLLSII